MAEQHNTRIAFDWIWFFLVLDTQGVPIPVPVPVTDVLSQSLRPSIVPLLSLTHYWTNSQSTVPLCARQDPFRNHGTGTYPGTGR